MPTTGTTATHRYDTLDLTVDGRVAWIRFTRPERLNSITEDVLSDLEAALGAATAAEQVRAAVLTGSGRAFSVGLDLDLLDRAFREPDYLDGVITRLGALLRTIERLPVPVVAAVNGLARAGGFELMLACDLVVISEEARIGDVHTPFGVIPAGGATVRLPRVVGVQRAREILLTGRWLTAQEAVELGLALHAVPAAELTAAAAELAARLTDKPRECLGALKRQLVETADLPAEAALAAERRVFLEYVTPPGSAAQEGFRAARERREPAWR